MIPPDRRLGVAMLAVFPLALFGDWLAKVFNRRWRRVSKRDAK